MEVGCCSSALSELKIGVEPGREKGSDTKSRKRPFGCFALLVSDPFSRQPKIQGLAMN